MVFGIHAFLVDRTRKILKNFDFPYDFDVFLSMIDPICKDFKNHQHNCSILVGSSRLRVDVNAVRSAVISSQTVE